MAGIGFMGGLGAAGNGFMEGMNQAQDRKAMLEEREFVKGQRQRKLDEQGREDQLRNDIKNTSQTENVQVEDPDAPPVMGAEPAYDGVGPVQQTPALKTVTKDRNQDAVYRDYAAAYQKQGDIAKAAEFNEKADKLAFQRTGRQVNEVLTGGGDLYTKAKRASELFHDDPFGGGVKGDPIKNEDGSVTLNLYNKDNPGKVFPKTFKSEQELAESLQSHYSPETYAKLQDTRMKINEEIAKNPYQTVAPGATALDKRTGKPVYNNPTDRTVTGYDDQGNAIFGKPIGGMGTGAGGGAGKAGKGGATDPASAALAHYDNITQHSEDKLPIDQSAQARDYVSRLATTNPSMPPAMVSRVAIAAAKDPSKLVPAINPDTGLIDTVFDDGQNGKITFNAGVGSALKPGSLKPEQLQQMTQTLLASKSPQERTDLVAAANNPQARAALEGKMRQQAADVIAQRTQGLSPEQAQVVSQQVNQALETKLGYLGNNLDMIHSYGERPAPQKQNSSSQIKQPGGLGFTEDPNSPAGRSQAKQAQLKAENAAKEQKKLETQQALSKQFQADKASMQPLELAQKYGDMRFQLPTADAAELQRIERTIR
jgi:hypothetical protein